MLQAKGKLQHDTVVQFVRKVFFFFLQNTRSCASQCEKDSAARRLHVLRTWWEILRDLTRKGKAKQRKERPPRRRIDLCLAPHDPSARMVATTFKLSNRLRLVGISSFQALQRNIIYFHCYVLTENQVSFQAQELVFKKNQLSFM